MRGRQALPRAAHVEIDPSRESLADAAPGRPKPGGTSERIRREFGFVPKRTIGEAVAVLNTAFKTGRLPDPMTDSRYYNIRVMQVNPSEVLTGFGAETRSEARPDNPSKLHAPDVAQAIVSMLETADRGFITESTIWATNPQ